MEIRKQYADLVAALMPSAPPFQENVEFKDTTADGVKVRVYNPKESKGSLPIGVWTHGGVSMLNIHVTCCLLSKLGLHGRRP